MSISIKQIAIPVYSRNLLALKTMLQKGERYAGLENIELNDLVESKLAEDMHPLIWQVQKATGTVIHSLSELGTIDPQRISEPKENYLELQRRVESTLDFVSNFDLSNLHNAELRRIKMNTSEGTIEIDGLTYLMSYAFPNFYFHMAGTFNILRSIGVKINKLDFLGGK